MTDSHIAPAKNSAPPAWQVGIVAGVLLIVAALLLFDTWRSGRPIDLPNAAHGKLECASYTPSHNGRRLDLAQKRALVTSDLKVLAETFRCVRTYSVSEGLDDVPRVARELGLKVMLGLWISMDAPSNDREIAHGVDLANQYADVVTAVVVGNEVLLRRELTAPQLRTLLERVRAATKVPVTYADVWEFWLRNADLANAADFVTIHILPYWEDNPIDIDRALDHVQNIYKKVQTAFPGRRVFIGETGWPSAGRPRLNAIPSLTNEARFVREFAAYAEREKIPYNLIEAFDQPWKRDQEGTVGGYWGLYNTKGEPKFAFAGPLIADTSWRVAALISLYGAALFGAIGWLLRPRPSTRALALMAIAGHAAGSLLVRQWLYVSTANRTTLEWVATVSWSLVGWCGVLAVMVAIARWLDGSVVRRPIGIANILHGLGHGAKKTDRSGRVLGFTRVLTLFGIAYVCLGLTYEGRGRDFPIALMAFPTIAFSLFELVTPPVSDRSIDHEELLLAFILIATSAYVAFNESFINMRAMAWCGLCVLFAAAIIFGQWRALHPHQTAKQETDTAQLERV
jgi:glucan 1,3-beta-glucosidase